MAKKAIKKPGRIKKAGAKQRKPLLRNAPAQETIYTIRTINTINADLDAIREPLRVAMGVEFPLMEDFNAFKATVQPASAGPTVSTEVRAMGYRFKTADGGHVVHFMLDGLVVNWVRTAYQGFDDSLKVMARYWQIHQQFFNPIGVDHVALRYINQLHLPMDEGKGLSFKNFIKNGPNLPDITGLTFAGFQQFAELVKQPEGIRSRVMTATLVPVDGHLPLLFDYEAFLSLEDESRRDTIAVWAALRQVHEWCGTFFNETLTERCHELFS